MIPMNKLLIGLIGVCVAVGAALQFTGTVNIGDYLADPLSKLSEVFSQVKADPVTFLKSNIELIAGGVTVVTVAYGALSNAFGKANTKIKQAEAKTTEISSDYLKLEQAKTVADQALSEATNEVSTLKAAAESHQQTVSNLELQLAQIQKQKDELNSIVSWVDKKTLLQRVDKPLIH